MATEFVYARYEFLTYQLIDEIHKEYPDINLSSAVEAYYMKDAKYPVFSQDTEQNSGEENESVDDEEASSKEEGGSQEEPIEDSLGDQNEDTMNPVITEADKRGVSESNKSPTDVHNEFPERPTNEVDRGQKDSNTECSRTNIPDTPSMNVKESAAYVGRIILELSESDQVPNRDISGEQSLMEHVGAAEALMPTKQVVAITVGLEEKNKVDLRIKNKNQWKLSFQVVLL